MSLCCRVPRIGGKALDLHRLFVEVTLRGGLEKVYQNLLVSLFHISVHIVKDFNFIARGWVGIYLYVIPKGRHFLIQKDISEQFAFS